MPRASAGPRLVLYGPDTKHGAKAKAGFRTYLWYIVWYEKGAKRERATGFGVGGESEAQDALAEFVGARRPTRPGCRRPDQITVAEALDLYATEHAPNTHNPERIGYAIAAMVPLIGDATLDTMTAGARRAYVKQRKRAAGTVLKELGVLDAACRHCVKEGHLTYYPEEQWLPPRPPSKERWLTRKEAAALIRGARKPPHSERVPTARYHLPLFVLVGLYTGRRKEAILTLQWQPNFEGGCVDLGRRIIDFDPVGREITNKRRGKIRIPDRLYRFLVAARKRTRQYVIEFEGQRVQDIKGSFATACDVAALENVTPHTMRHTLATWLAQRGVPPLEASDFLGMELETYLRRYRHHHPDHMKSAMEALR